MTVAERFCWCGARVSAGDGPVHSYMHAAPGCWELYCSLEDWKASLSGSAAVTAVQQLVDLYAVQHAANPERRNRQSVAVHLMSLCASLERGMPGVTLRRVMGEWTHHDYPVLEPRPASFSVTIRDIAEAPVAERSAVIGAGARASWEAWSAHHDQVRLWLDQAGSGSLTRRGDEAGKSQSSW